MQIGAIILNKAVLSIEFPPATQDVIPGVQWGAIEEFPSPAYWAYQVYARRVNGTTMNYKLGRSLLEEVGACLLGGHGIPAGVGLAAFEKMRDKGVFSSLSVDEETLLSWLAEPMLVNGRSVRYRFARQKARYLTAAIKKIQSGIPTFESGKSLRDWLLDIPGIGYKTASWIARNWLDADDVAILDIHILRAGKQARFFDSALTVERDYLKLETQFLEFSEALGVRASELDALMWYEMMSSSRTVHKLLGGSDTSLVQNKNRHLKIGGRAKDSHSDPRQASLLV